MGHITKIGNTRCFFCKKIISRNGFGHAAHMRKHVREGIALEINSRHPKYNGYLEFINLRHYAKVGTIPSLIIFKGWYTLKKGALVYFRYEDDNVFQKGIINDFNHNCIFIELI